jgi:hypothetical protein
MLEPIFSFFEKLISEFTWQRLAFSLGAIALFATFVMLYESYTSHFTLNRIGKELVD